MKRYKSRKNTIRCAACGSDFLGGLNHKFCSKSCERKTNAPLRENLNISSGKVGTISELLVCIDLMKKGWEVYKAIYQSSFCAAIAIKNGVILKLEIRTGYYNKNKDGGLNLHYARNKIYDKNVAVYTAYDNKIHYIGFSPDEKLPD